MKNMEQLNYAGRLNNGLNIEMIKQKIRNADSTLLALTILLVLILLVGSVIAESSTNSNNDKVGSTNSNSESYFEKEIELSVGESEIVSNLEILLEDLIILKSNPSVYQATIKYGVLPEGLNKPITSINLVQGEKKLTQLSPSEFTIFFKSLSDDGKKAKFVISISSKLSKKIGNDNTCVFNTETQTCTFNKNSVEESFCATEEDENGNKIEKCESSKTVCILSKDNNCVARSCPVDSFWNEEEDRCVSSNLVKIVLEPKRQISSDGKATYEVTVKDSHPLICKGEDAACLGFKTYKYTLSFEAKDTIGTFSETELEIQEGRKKSVELTVNSEEKGVHPFNVIVKGESVSDSVKGVLIVGEISSTEGNAYFLGTGFALNSDETKGQIVELKVLNDGNSLSGKISLERGQPNRLEGTISDSAVSFEIFKVDSKEKIGSFSGTLKKFDDFLLLKGDLILNDETYKLTAISRKNVGIKESISEEGKITETTKVKEVIVITKTEGSATNSETETEDGEVYVRTVKVRNQKIFGIFPTGKKVVDVEVIDGEKITKKAVEEKSKEKMGNYNVEVGSLDDEENIEINVEKSA